MAYGFRPMTAADLPMIRRWLEVPHVAEWWRDPTSVRNAPEKLLAEGVPRIVIDPDPNNARAIRAYEKAGFHRDRLAATPDGPALLMIRDT